MKWLLFILANVACLSTSCYLIAQGTVIVTLRSKCPSSLAHIEISKSQFDPMVTLGERKLFVIVGSGEGNVILSLQDENRSRIPGSYVTSPMISYFNIWADRKCKVGGGRWKI